MSFTKRQPVITGLIIMLIGVAVFLISGALEKDPDTNEPTVVSRVMFWGGVVVMITGFLALFRSPLVREFALFAFILEIVERMLNVLL